MNMHEHDFDREMRKKFEGFRPDVSQNLWDKISAELDEREAKEKPIITMSSSRGRHIGWWMSAAAVLVLGMFALWLYHPVEVVYLQGVAVVEDVEAPEVTVSMESEGTAVEEHVEPLSLEPIRALFAESNRRKQARMALQNEENQAPQVETLPHVPEEHPADEAMEMASIRPEETIERVPQETVGLDPAGEAISTGEYAGVVEPLVVPDNFGVEVLEDQVGEKAFGVSNILNLVVGSVDPREEKLVTFSNDDEGLIKMAFNLGLNNKTRKRD